MPTIVYHHTAGAPETRTVPAGTTVMIAAISGHVEGIVGECGGFMQCATCHVYVHEAYLDQLPSISEDEDAMLGETAATRDPARSRLGCQLVLGPSLDHLEVDLPDVQY